MDEPPRWHTWAAGLDGYWKLASEAEIGSDDYSDKNDGGDGGFDYQIYKELLVGFEERERESAF